MNDQTVAIHGHGFFDEKLGVFIPPIYQTAIFEQPGYTRQSDRGLDLKYSREENPTVRCVEHVITKLEHGGDTLCFSSGMAAISCLLISTLRSGCVVLLPKEAYGSTIQLVQDLCRFNIKVVFAEPNTERFIEMISKDVSLVFVETITNPMLRVLDIPEIVKKCRDFEIPVAVDNTFTTPILYKPLMDGVDYVIHSMTKYLAGHNDVVAGCITGSKDFINDMWHWRRKLGTIASPFDAYLVLRGLKTLKLRVEKHCENAKIIAEFLSNHPKISKVYYPGLPDNEYHSIARRLFNNRYGGVVSFKIRGGREEVVKIMKSLKIIRPSPSLGGVESLLTYPIISAAMGIDESIRRSLGITEDLLRLSVGLEDVNDLIEDLDRALSNI
jgi:cystathionine gamma-synthase